jgi:CheY-like chemotaxis protein
VARLLVVDDDEDMTDLVSRVLGRDGHRVTTASNPSEATKELQQHVFDAMLLDIDMPEMDGLTFSKLLQDNPRFLGYADMPVIIVSGRTDPGIMGESFDAGAVYFLQKPFETNELRDTVRLVLKTGS